MDEKMKEHQQELAYCIGCGCDDYHACVDRARQEPCHWTRVDYGTGLGVCSSCQDLAKAWDAGDRSMRVTPAQRLARRRGQG